MFVFEYEVDQHPKFLVTPFPAPGLYLFSAGPDTSVFFLNLPEEENGVVGGQPKQKICQIINPTEILPFNLSSLLQMLIGQQLQLRVSLQILLPLVHKLKHLQQLAEHDHPDLLITHQSV